MHDFFISNLVINLLFFLILFKFEQICDFHPAPAPAPPPAQRLSAFAVSFPIASFSSCLALPRPRSGQP